MIPWSTRKDLTVVKTQSGIEEQFAVKDEIRNEFYYFGSIEYFILESLKLPCSVETLVGEVEQEFGLRLTAGELESYVHRLARDNLMVAARFGDGDRLLKQSSDQQKATRLQALSGLLSIRFRGFHPGQMLRWLTLPGFLLFHPVTMIFVAAAACLTVVLAALSLDTVIQKIPSFHSMTQPGVVVMMFVGFIIAKIFHELGHGLACQRAGHECNEMGLMLLVGIPCMYCDVSDVWTQPNRWQRMFVSAAGIYVELIISTVCFWAWYFSVPGTIHCVFFGMMLVTSVNTLFINGNPLMRYDGYYVLSDWLKIPNLSSAASQLWQSRLRNTFVAGQQQFSLNQPRTTLFTYAVLAAAYRLFIMAAIGWGVWLFFDSQQLQELGKVAVWCIVGLSLLPVLMTTRTLTQAAWREGLKLTNVTVLVSLLILAYFCLSTIQFDYRVYGTAEIQLADAKPIFAPDDGAFTALVNDGQQVTKSVPIAKIDDPELRLEAKVTEGELLEIQARLELLEFSNEVDQAGQIAFWTKRKNSVNLRLKELHSRLDRLTILAPQDGLLVAYEKVANESLNEAALDSLSGTHFDDTNRGSHVKRGEPLAYVASESNCRGHLKIRESEIEYTRVGQPVRLRLPYSNDYLFGKVTRIGLESESGEELAQPDTDSMYVRVEFDFPSHPAIRIGSVHPVSIQCQPISPLGYLARWWRTTFWF